MRKRYLINLESRTSEQLAEEEALYVEIRRLEQTERRFKREREDLLRTLAGMDSGLPDIVEDDGGPLGVTPESRSSKKRKGGLSGVDTDSAPTPSAVSSVSSPVKRLASTRDAAFGEYLPLSLSLRVLTGCKDAKHCIIRTGDGSGTTKAAHTPAYLRSQKIPWLKNNSIQTKVVQAFTEMGLSPSRLVMPTKENVAQLESLIEAITAMAETKKLLDKVDYDIQVIKKQLESRADGDVDIKSEPEGMEIEDIAETETDGNEGRGESVISTRSVGRSVRKKVRVSRVYQLTRAT